MAQVFRKVTEFKTVNEFAAYLESENIKIGLAETVPGGDRKSVV